MLTCLNFFFDCGKSTVLLQSFGTADFKTSCSKALIALKIRAMSKSFLILFLEAKIKADCAYTVGFVYLIYQFQHYFLSSLLLLFSDHRSAKNSFAFRKEP